MKKRIVYSAAILLVICIGYMSLYFHQYHIKNTSNSIQSNINKWLELDKSPHNANVLDLINLKSTRSYIAIIQEKNKKIEYIHLIKGWNSRYKISDSGSTNSISYYQIKTNRGFYGILFGTNPNFMVNQVEVKLNNFNLVSKIPKKRHFIIYKKLSKKTAGSLPYKLTFYDQGNNIIPVDELQSKIQLFY